MLPTPSLALRVIDAAYDLDSHPKPWLGGLLESGEEVLDQGLGCAAVTIAGLTRSGEPLVSRVVTHGNASRELALRLARASRSAQLEPAAMPSDGLRSAVRTLSQLRSAAPRLHYAVRRHLGCKDALCLLTIDSEMHGVLLLTPTRGQISLSATAENRWRTLASHIGAADRLRRALGPSLRDAALQIDSEPRRRPQAQATEAFELLHGLINGQLSMIDGFVSNGRHFTLVRPGDPSLRDPRALTARERQVVLRTARGESRKLVAYHIGISRSGVSKLLGTAMRKLGVRNQTELVMKVRCLEDHGLLSAC